MPRPRTTDRDLRSRALKIAIARSQIDLGLKNGFQMMEYLGEPKSTYGRRKRDPYKEYGYEKAVNHARKMRLTASEILDIFGFKEEQQ